ncbi:MAG: response regulator transcription factor [Solirubrobacteraceae bacterium]
MGESVARDSGRARPKTSLNDDLRVIVVDDHELFRRGVTGLLQEHGIEVIGEAGLAADGVRLAVNAGPCVVLMDLSLPGMSGIEATQHLTATAPLARVLVLTVFVDDQHIIDALLAGACGYMLKDAPIEHIVDGIRAAARGESLISPRIASRLVRRLREPDGLEVLVTEDALTPRELEVLELLSRGLDNAGIARALYLSQHTVKNHVSTILMKLQVDNRIQAAVRAVRGGLV